MVSHSKFHMSSFFNCIALMFVLCFFQVPLYLSYHVLNFLEHLWSNHESVSRVTPTNHSCTLFAIQYLERAQLSRSLVPIVICKFHQVWVVFPLVRFCSYIHAEHIFYDMVFPFGLSICLWMITCAEIQIII
jgi:hypothetical protein